MKVKSFPIIFIIYSLITTSCERRDFNIVAKAETGNVTEIMATSAKVSGNIVDLGEGISDYGHCWAQTSQPTVQNYKTSFGKADKLSAIVSIINSLELGKIYHIRAYVVSGKEVIYGDDIQFTTQNGQAILTTSNVTDITINSAKCGGTVTSDGGASIITSGICWSTNPNPTIELSTKTSDNNGIGSYISNLTSLVPNTLYHVRAYASNSVGTYYGSEVSFTTLDGKIVISTTAITNITSTSATSGGSISTDGGSPVTVRGICWSTNPNPTIADSYSNDGAGKGIYTSILSGLILSPNYYVRAYATNNFGTVYGNELNFSNISTGVAYGGGYVYYLDGTGKHGLIYNLQGFRGFLPWGCAGTIIAGANGTAVGTGMQNTNSIVNVCSTSGIAARYCYDLVLNGYDDWFLPSKDELSLLYNYIGGNLPFDYSCLWSSSQYSSSKAWLQIFTPGQGWSGLQDVVEKQYSQGGSGASFGAMPIRAF